jgi:hypothetical protein
MAIGVMMFINTLRTSSALLCPMQLALENLFDITKMCPLENLSGITKMCPDACQTFCFWFFRYYGLLVVPIFSIWMAFKSGNIEIKPRGISQQWFQAG